MWRFQQVSAIKLCRPTNAFLNKCVCACACLRVRLRARVCVQETSGEKTNNGIHYRLQLLYSNGRSQTFMYSPSIDFHWSVCQFPWCSHIIMLIIILTILIIIVMLVMITTHRKSKWVVFPPDIWHVIREARQATTLCLWVHHLLGKCVLLLPGRTVPSAALNQFVQAACWPYSATQRPWINTAGASSVILCSVITGRRAELEFYFYFYFFFSICVFMKF